MEPGWSGSVMLLYIYHLPFSLFKQQHIHKYTFMTRFFASLTSRAAVWSRLPLRSGASSASSANKAPPSSSSSSWNLSPSDRWNVPWVCPSPSEYVNFSYIRNISFLSSCDTKRALSDPAFWNQVQNMNKANFIWCAVQAVFKNGRNPPELTSWQPWLQANLPFKCHTSGSGHETRK